MAKAITAALCQQEVGACIELSIYLALIRPLHCSCMDMPLGDWLIGKRPSTMCNTCSCTTRILHFRRYTHPSILQTHDGCRSGRHSGPLTCITDQLSSNWSRCNLAQRRDGHLELLQSCSNSCSPVLHSLLHLTILHYAQKSPWYPRPSFGKVQ